MNAECLLQHFDRISEVPDAIPRLRRFILDLAIRGRLVEHAPNDESAEELLKRIQEEKIRLVKEGKIRQQKPLEAVNDENLPFAVPKHWAWLQLCEIGTLSGGMTPSKNRSDYWEGEINWFSPKDIKSDELFDSELKITSAGVTETGLQLYPSGCLFMVARSGILKRTFPVSINRVEATANQDLKVLNPFVGGLERYLQITLRGMTDFILSALVKTGTTVQSLKYEEFELQPLPLPPLAEQHHIVAKVDELMALCDQLEVAKTEREQSHDRLVAASLHRLNSPADTAEADAPDLPARQAGAFRDHALFVFNHLPRLTTRPEHIKQLRQTILNLAVCGKLVSQDPKEGMGDELLERIKAVHPPNRNFGSGRKKGQPQIDPLNCPELFPIPPSWRWAYLDFICEQIADVDHNMPKAVDKGIPFISAKDLKDDGTIDFSNPKMISEADYERLSRKIQMQRGDIVYSRIGARLGKARLVEVDIRFLISYSCCLVRPLHHFVDKHYVQRFLDSTIALSQAHRGTQSIGVPDLGLGEIKEFKIPLPPLAEQYRIVAG